jgi:cytoskeletal protein CcmA (bactofilin family)
MFNRDALFGKKEDAPRNEPRSSVNVNVTPGLGGANPPTRPQPSVEPKQDLRFAEVSKPQPQPPRVEEPAGSRLIVGPDIKLKGVEITDCDTLVVEGRVEASMDSRVIQIAENGVFSGTVSIDVAEVRGRFEGTLTARKQLVIYSTGSVSGLIRYGKIRIEEGGELLGEISTLVKEPPVVAAAAPAASASGTPTAAATPTAAPAAATPASAAAAAATPAAAAGSAQASRPAQPGAPSMANSHASAAVAARDAAAQRPPRPAGKPNNAGVNTV